MLDSCRGILRLVLRGDTVDRDALSSISLHEANVVFLGSTWANELQEKFNADDTPLVCYGRERIVNRQPRAGEPAEFVPVYDPKTRELLASYVLFWVLFRLADIWLLPAILYGRDHPYAQPPSGSGTAAG